MVIVLLALILIGIMGGVLDILHGFLVDKFEEEDSQKRANVSE